MPNLLALAAAIATYNYAFKRAKTNLPFESKDEEVLGLWAIRAVAFLCAVKSYTWTEFIMYTWS